MLKVSEVSGSILVVPDGKGHCLVGLVSQVFWTQIHICFTYCMWGACLGLRSCFRVVSWFGGPSGLISAFADEESRPRERARLDQGCFRPREFSDKTVSGIWASCTRESASQKLCDCCMRLSSCGMKVLLCGTPGLSGLSGDYLTASFFVGCLSTAAWREGGLFFLKSSWLEGLGSFVWSPRVLSQQMPWSMGMIVWGTAVWYQRGLTKTWAWPVLVEQFINNHTSPFILFLKSVCVCVCVCTERIKC